MVTYLYIYIYISFGHRLERPSSKLLLAGFTGNFQSGLRYAFLESLG